MNIKSVIQNPFSGITSISDARARWRDAFSAAQSVEKFLLLFAFNWFAWFLIFDVAKHQPVVDVSHFLHVIIWDLMFLGVFVVHLSAILFKSKLGRFAACFFHSVIWVAWLILAASVTIGATITPTLIGLATMAMYAMNRVYKTL